MLEILLPDLSFLVSNQMWLFCFDWMMRLEVGNIVTRVRLVISFKYLFISLPFLLRMFNLSIFHDIMFESVVDIEILAINER